MTSSGMENNRLIVIQGNPGSAIARYGGHIINAMKKLANNACIVRVGAVRESGSAQIANTDIRTIGNRKGVITNGASAAKKNPEMRQ